MGVRAEHYSTMGMCLLLTVRTCLGSLYTDERHRAWSVSVQSCQCSQLRVELVVVSN